MPVLKDLRLEHYTDQPFEFDRRTYEQQPPLGYLKANGLWVSVAGEHDWPWWCRGEEFCLSHLEHVAVVVLRDDANVHLISTPEELDAFHQKYAYEDVDGFRSLSGGKNYWSIDWRKVAVDYDGLIIAPYVWQRRLDLMWYYGWDCASGVIWNLDAVAEVIS